MKKTLLMFMILAIAALWLGWSTKAPALKSQIAEGNTPSASLSKEKSPELVEPAQRSEEQIRFTEALEELELVTEEYNRKALAGELTNEDEQNYAKASKVAAAAFAQYQKNSIQQLKSLGDI
ncbi:MAG: hypothetical protein ACLGG0_03030 [Bacteriovoracia bacterium]